MNTRSGKAKGRTLQNKIRDMYRSIGSLYGLQDGDIESRPMGQAGVDLIFSPAAQILFNQKIEAKKHAAVRIPYHFKQHYEKHKDNDSLKLLFSENNRDQTLVTMRAEDFMLIVEELLNLQTKDS